MKQLKTMPKTTIILIGFLAFLTIGLIIFALYVKPLDLTQKPQDTSTQDEDEVPSYAQSVLRIGDAIPSDPISSTSATYESVISIETGENKITAVQIELQYEPGSFTNVDIKPGTFIPNALVLLKKIDPAEGRITFAIALPLGLKGIQGQGDVAVLTFGHSSVGSYGIGFLPKTQITAEGISQSVLKEAVNNTFELED